MGPGAYVVGMLFLLGAVGATAFAAGRVCAHWLPKLAGCARALALALLTGSALSFSMLLPGALGILTRGTFLGTAIGLALLAAFLSPARRVRPPSGWKPRPGMVFGALATIVLAVWLIAELIQLETKPPLGVDFISYDLPVIGRWIQSGTVWPITELFPLQTHGTYPQTADLLLGAFVLAFHNDGLVGALPCLALVVTGLACFCAARELGARPSTAAAIAAMFCATPTVAWEVQASPPDAVALSALAVGAMFLLRHVRSQQPAELVLAGLGLGFAAGSLWYFTSAVAVIAVIWVVACLVQVRLGGSRSWRQAGSRAGLLVGVIVAAAGFWLVRNLVETGDPVYPVRIALAGHTIFPAPPDLYRAVSGFSISDYLGSPHILRQYILPALRKTVGLPGVLLLLGLPLVGGRSARMLAQRRRPAGLAVALLLTSLLLAVLYILTPYSAFGLQGRPVLAWVNVRYLIPALAVAAAALAAAVASYPRWASMLVEVVACVATIQGLHAADAVVGTKTKYLVVAGAATLALIAGIWLWRMGARRGLPALGPRTALLTGAAVSAVLLGYLAQRKVNAVRYAPYDPTFAWVQRHPRALKIGLAGSFNFRGVSPGWPMFGERIQNRVAFVGQLRSGHLAQYTSRQAWLAAVRRSHDEVLEIAIGPPSPGTSDNEPRWAAQSGFPVLARSSRLELVQVPPAL